MKQRATGARKPEIVAASPAMERVREALERVAGTDVPVVLYGEVGVGKSLASRFVHSRSPRGRGPFARLSLRDEGALGVLGDPAFLSSLEGGTLVLEGLDEAPATVQVRLLGVLESWGAAEEGEPPPPVRVIATATRDLRSAVEEGRFRADVCYLVEVFPIRIPPLRERYEDIPALVRHLFRRHAPGVPFPGIPAEFLERAGTYPWPGNVRELENLIRTSLPVGSGGRWEPQALLPRDARSVPVVPFAEAKRAFEREYVSRILLITAGNVTRAARVAGKARKDFYTLMARNEIDPTVFRPSRPGREGWEPGSPGEGR